MGPRILKALGIGAAAAVGGYLLTRGGGGHPLILYQTVGRDLGEIRDTAENLRGVLPNATTVGVPNANTVYQAIRDQPGKLSSVVLVGHGTPRNFFTSYGTSPTRLAQELAPKLTSRSFIGLAGCRAGADPGEQDWSTRSYGPGGALGFAGRLRDALVAAGAPRGVQVRAHSTTGHLTANPAARSFVVAAHLVGQPGISVLDQVWGVGSWQNAALRRAWTDQFRGKLAELWVAGFPIPRLALPA